MARASERIAAAVTTGLLHSIRDPYRTSRITASSQGSSFTSRLVSRTCHWFPSRLRASRAASAGVMPRRVNSAARVSKWKRISSARSWFRRSLRNTLTRREIQDMAPPKSLLLGSLQHVIDRRCDGAPTTFGFLQLLAAGCRYFVNAGTAFVLGDHPLRGNPAGFF